MRLDQGVVGDGIGLDPGFRHECDERFRLFELAFLAEDVDHDVEGGDGGAYLGAEHLGVDGPGEGEVVGVAEEGGEEAVAGAGLGGDLGGDHEVEDAEGFARVRVRV